jgi:hypothetical protein
MLTHGVGLSAGLRWPARCSGRVLRGPGMKARHRHAADAHHLAMLRDGRARAKQELPSAIRDGAFLDHAPQRRAGPTAEPQLRQHVGGAAQRAGLAAAVKVVPLPVGGEGLALRAQTGRPRKAE